MSTTFPATRRPRKAQRLLSVASSGQRLTPQALPKLREALQLRGTLSSAQQAASLAQLQWGNLPDTDDSVLRKTLVLLGRGGVNAQRVKQIGEHVNRWLTEPAGEHQARIGMLLLVALPSIGSLLADELFLSILQRCDDLSSAAAGESWQSDPIRFQLLAVEMAYALAGIYALIGEGRELPARAERCWLQLGEEWLDGEGVPHGRYLAAMRPVLASWTRCLGQAVVGETVRDHFVWLLRQTLRFTRSDGAAAFSLTASLNRGKQADGPFHDCLALAVSLAGDETSTALYKSLYLGEAARTSRKLKISPSVYSEWSSAATLRGDVQRTSPQISVAFDTSDCRLEVVAEQPLLSGNWIAELAVEGRSLSQVAGWEETCWFEDDDAVYLELEAKFESSWRVQRHILLARREGFALLADAVLGEGETAIEYSSALSLWEGVKLEPQADTHEAWLVGRNRRWLALPLWLPEWRADRPFGSLTANDGSLRMRHARHGRNLFVPLFLPLRNLRPATEYTWRKLTVADQLAVQPADVAAAWRVQVGDRQWSFYRSLSERANRTFLGHNLTTEFFAGVFHRTGEHEVIVEVE